MNRNSKKKNPSEWWCYYFCVYTLGSAPGHYLDPRPLDVIASKSKDRLPASACHLTSTGCQTDVSFHLSPDGPHILSIKVSFSFSCDYRCLGKFAEKYWSSPQKMYVYTNISCNSKWSLINPGLSSPVLGATDGREAPRCCVKGVLGQQDPSPTPYPGANAQRSLKVNRQKNQH